MKKTYFAGLIALGLISNLSSEAINPTTSTTISATDREAERQYQLIRKDCQRRQFLNAREEILKFFNADGSLKEEYNNIPDARKAGLRAHYAETLTSIPNITKAAQEFRILLHAYTDMRSNHTPLITILHPTLVYKINFHLLSRALLINELPTLASMLTPLFSEDGNELPELNRWAESGDNFKAETRRLLTMVLFHLKKYQETINIGRCFFDNDGNINQAYRNKISDTFSAILENAPITYLRYAVGMSYANLAVEKKDLIETTFAHVAQHVGDVGVGTEKIDYEETGMGVDLRQNAMSSALTGLQDATTSIEEERIA